VNGTLTGIGTLSTRPITIPNGVNSAGVVVGTSNLADMSMPLQYNRAFITQAGVPADLLSGTAANNSTAIAINDAGQVLGTNITGSFLWQGGTAAALFPASMGKAAALAANGAVAGNGADAKAFLYKDGTITPCGTLGTGASSTAAGINDAGDVVGSALIAPVVGGQPAENHAFVCRAGAMTDLGTLYGAGTSGANDINNQGEIVGQNSDTANVVRGSTSHAFVHRGGHMINLSDKIPTGSSFTALTYAFAINDAGQIIGRGVKGDAAHSYAFLLTPRR
jgi:probable HAF family extracellular repeat protein